MYNGSKNIKANRMSAMDEECNVSSRRMQMKLENVFGNAAAADPQDSSSTMPGPSQYSTLRDDVNSSMNDGQEAQPTECAEPFEFKTPTPMRPPRSTNSSKTSMSLGKPKNSAVNVVDSELSSENQKSMLSSKKNPALKIASFAKASVVDRLSPTEAVTVDPSLDSGPSESPNFPATGSKQLTTQTMLPTPDLNAALRSFFHYAAQSEGSPCTDASDDEEEDEDEDVEVEEILVYMQFDSKLDSDLLQPHTPFKIIGVDSEKPVLQLGNQVFEGNWNDTVGTAVFFEENPSASPGDPVFMKSPPLTLNYHSKTQKSLVMSRIFVRPKDENDTDSTSVPAASAEVAS